MNSGTDRFLPGHPLDLLKKRKFPEIPLILGFNAQEAAFMIPLLMTSLERGKSKFENLFNLEATSELEVRSKKSQYLHSSVVPNWKLNFII